MPLAFTHEDFLVAKLFDTDSKICFPSEISDGRDLCLQGYRITITDIDQRYKTAVYKSSTKTFHGLIGFPTQPNGSFESVQEPF